jgi:hypothetical protein
MTSTTLPVQICKYISALQGLRLYSGVAEDSDLLGCAGVSFEHYKTAQNIFREKIF